VAEATAKEIGQISLREALELTVLIARKEPHRHPRVAARWLVRYLEEFPTATIEEAGVVVACLQAVSSPVTTRPRGRSEPWPEERLGAGERGAYADCGPGGWVAPRVFSSPPAQTWCGGDKQCFDGHTAPKKLQCSTFAQ
jgi:hypothetical protein